MSSFSELLFQCAYMDFKWSTSCWVVSNIKRYSDEKTASDVFACWSRGSCVIYKDIGDVEKQNANTRDKFHEVNGQVSTLLSSNNPTHHKDDGTYGPQECIVRTYGVYRI